MHLYMQILVVRIGRLNHLAVRTHSPSSHHFSFQEIVQAFAQCIFLYLLCLKRCDMKDLVLSKLMLHEVA
jgi:hypothetical protein